MYNVKETLMQQARAKGICEDGYSYMRVLGADALISYYLANPDWCLERDFPDWETLVREYSDCDHRGVFVNKAFRGQSFSSEQTYVFHHCQGLINVAMDYDKAVIPMLYFANGCDLHVQCDQKNTPTIKIPLYVFGDNNITFSGDGAEFKVYRAEAALVS